MNVFLKETMNIPAFSVVTYYGNFHSHYQQDYIYQASQLLAVGFSAFLKWSENDFFFCYAKS
jgi:hypothetical protein